MLTQHNDCFALMMKEIERLFDFPSIGDTTDSLLTSHWLWASTEMFFLGRGWSGRLFEDGHFFTFWASRVGA